MARIPEPGDFGFSESVFFPFGINVALRLARHVGLGLNLVNALRDRFPEIELDFAGEIAGIVGAGVRAGVGLKFDDPESEVTVGQLPKLPRGLFEDNEADRILVKAQVTYQDGETGEVKIHDVTIFVTDTTQISEIMQDVIQEFEDALDESPTDNAAATKVIEVSPYFAGRRF